VRPGSRWKWALALATLVAVPGAAAAAPLAVATGPGVTVQPFTAYGAARPRVVAVGTPGAFTVPVEIPPRARLFGAVAVPDRVWTTTVVERASPVRFTIQFESDGDVIPLYDRTIDIRTQPAERRWFDFGRDLTALAGRRGTLRFTVATPAPADPATLALWAIPQLASCPDAGPSLLLITIDALRADHLGGAGYARATSPHLDAFAADATRFAAAYAAAPKTIPSIPQMLTGRYFPAHGGEGALAALVGPEGVAASRAIVNNPYVDRWLAAQEPGFDTRIAGELDARAITSDALRFLTAAGRCRTALYLHYLEPHTPHQSPARYARRFIDPSAATTVGLTFDDVTGAWQGRYGPEDRRRIIDLYDGAISYVDRQLGRLFRGLATRGRLEDTVVVVTADHGEELWDHGEFFHGQSLYDELLHVPLIVRLPRQGHGRVVADVVSTVDVLPTMLAAAGLAPIAADGISLVPAATGTAGADAAERVVFATVSHAEPRTPPRHAARSADAKVVRNVHDGTLAAFDLAHDPTERTPNDGTGTAARALRGVLDAVRLRIAAAGYQLRVQSRAETPLEYTLTVTGTPPVPLLDVDRLTLEATDAIVVGERSASLTVHGRLEPGDDDHVRFDVPAATGTLRVTVTAHGGHAADATIHIGAAGHRIDGPVDLADPRLVGEPPPHPARADASAVTVALWRVLLATPGVAAPPLSAAEEARLRALGYLD
jgi:arylsulfatase